MSDIVIAISFGALFNEEVGCSLVSKADDGLSELSRSAKPSRRLVSPLSVYNIWLPFFYN